MSVVELDNGLMKAFQDVHNVGTAFAQPGVPAEVCRDLSAKKAAEIVADPALDENTSGLVRQYFPKGTDPSAAIMRTRGGILSSRSKGRPRL